MAKRGSRCRSSALTARDIDPMNSSPSRELDLGAADPRRAVAPQRRERLVREAVEERPRARGQLRRLRLDLAPARHGAHVYRSAPAPPPPPPGRRRSRRRWAAAARGRARVTPRPPASCSPPRASWTFWNTPPDSTTRSVPRRAATSTHARGRRVRQRAVEAGRHDAGGDAGGGVAGDGDGSSRARRGPRRRATGSGYAPRSCGSQAASSSAAAWPS